MVYEFCVDNALSDMKVPSSVYEMNDQLFAMGICETMGYKPCETAVVISAKDDEFVRSSKGSHRTKACLKKWACDGSIDPKDPIVAHALSRLGFDDI